MKSTEAVFMLHQRPDDDEEDDVCAAFYLYAGPSCLGLRAAFLLADLHNQVEGWRSFCWTEE